MKNTLNKLPFYKSKSIMIIESSIGVNYGEASPFIQFKFATRADYKSQGNWDDANSYWITNYIDLFNFVNGINLVSSGKMEKYELKNPAKGIGLQIRHSVNTETNIEYVTFHFFRGQEVKISVSLVKSTEYLAMFSYFKNLLDNYNNVCATALFRNDFYYKNFVEGKDNKYNKNNGTTTNKYTQNNSKQSTNNASSGNSSQNNNFADDFSSGISSDESTVDFNDDVPF
jgi:hypothetical protein